MSILIKGMDMPTKGNPITVTIYPDGTAEWEAQHKTGTATPVPPHGDLVDQDEYRDEFMEGVYDLCNDDPDNYRANSIIDLFDAAPTIIPADTPKEESDG